MKISPEDVAASMDDESSDQAKQDVLEKIQSLMDELDSSRLSASIQLSRHKKKPEDEEEAAEGEPPAKGKDESESDGDLAKLKSLAKE